MRSVASNESLEEGWWPGEVSWRRWLCNWALADLRRQSWEGKLGPGQEDTGLLGKDFHRQWGLLERGSSWWPSHHLCSVLQGHWHLDLGQFPRNRQVLLARGGGVLSVHSLFGDRVPGLAHRSVLCLTVDPGSPRFPLGFWNGHAFFRAELWVRTSEALTCKGHPQILSSTEENVSGHVCVTANNCYPCVIMSKSFKFLVSIFSTVKSEW